MDIWLSAAAAAVECVCGTDKKLVLWEDIIRFNAHDYDYVVIESPTTATLADKRLLTNLLFVFAKPQSDW